MQPQSAEAGQLTTRLSIISGQTVRLSYTLKIAIYGQLISCFYRFTRHLVFSLEEPPACSTPPAFGIEIGLLDSQPLMDYAPVSDEDSGKYMTLNPLILKNLVSAHGNAVAIATRKEKSDAKFNDFFDEVRRSRKFFRLAVHVGGCFQISQLFRHYLGCFSLHLFFYSFEQSIPGCEPSQHRASSWATAGIPLTLLTTIVPSLVIVIAIDRRHPSFKFISPGGIDRSKKQIRQAIRFMAKHTGLAGHHQSVFYHCGISDIPLIQDFAPRLRFPIS